MSSRHDYLAYFLAQERALGSLFLTNTVGLMYWNRKIEIAGQVLIWLLLFGLSVSFLREITSFSNSLSLSVKGVVLLMVVAYLNSLYLIPRFFLQNQFSRYFFSIGLLVFGLLSLNYWLAEWPMFQMPPRDSMPFLRDLPMEQVVRDRKSVV